LKIENRAINKSRTGRTLSFAYTSSIVGGTIAIVPYEPGVEGAL